MLHFEMDVVAADTVERTIEGVIVPYGEVAKIAGLKYRFRPGSVRAARARTPLLLDHDRGRPVGVLAELVDGDAGAMAKFRIDATAAGDEALAQAASGSRGAFSVGASVEASEGHRDDVIEVVTGLVHEVSLLALGAFEGAAVTSVAAEQDEPEPEPEPDPDPPPAPPAEEEQTEMEDLTAAAPVMIHATAARAQREMTAGEVAVTLIKAQHGDREAMRYLEAALTESISTDVTGLLPPQYESGLIGARSTPRPLYSFFRSKPLPGVGLVLNKPKWVTPPVGAWAATVDADATSSKVTIGSQAANVERWDWAGAIPWVVVQRSSPDIIDAIYGEAVENFHLAVETRIAAKLAAASTNAATSIGAAVAAYYTANTRNPEGIIVAPDVWGKMADQKLIDATRATGDVSMSQDGMAGSWGGLPVFVSGSLAATFGYLVTRRAIDARITEPVRLTANAIGALNVELAVVGEGLFDTDYPNEIMELAPTIPIGLEAQGKSK
jgi:HK97 family phage prohead protease